MVWIKIQNHHIQRRFYQTRCPQGSVLRPLLHNLRYPTYIYDAYVVLTKPQIHEIRLKKLEQWLTTLRIRANESKSRHVTFALNRKTYPLIGINCPQSDKVRYLGFHHDRYLTWRILTEAKRSESIYWLVNQNSNLSLETRRPKSVMGSNENVRTKNSKSMQIFLPGTCYHTWLH